MNKKPTVLTKISWCTTGKLVSHRIERQALDWIVVPLNERQQIAN